MVKIILVQFFLSLLFPSFPLWDKSVSNQFQSPPPNEGEATNFLYLPIQFRQDIKPQSIFGAEVYSLDSQNLSRANTADLHWVRFPAFYWAEIETQRGIYDWNVVDNTGLSQFSSNGFEVIATIRLTPTWAQKIPGVSCGPIAATAFPDFYNFVYSLVQRYSANPYNVRYYEFFNEPDIASSTVEPDSLYGCWGDKTDTNYYGGEYFAEMLKVAYQAAKAANPSSQVMIGGLLLDCDPTNPPANGCRSGKFFEGILHNQGGSYFDIVSFHSYIYYYNNKILDEDSPKWGARGGQLTGKVSYLREVMNKAPYFINKPLFLSEVALKYCVNCGEPPALFYELQTDAVISTNARTWGMGLLGQTWFTLEDSGWAYSGLFTGNVPNPAFSALIFMKNKLDGASISREITEYQGLRGYEFLLPTSKIWLLWSPDGVTEKQIPKPSGVATLYDKYGESAATIPDQLSISHPVYLEFPR